MAGVEVESRPDPPRYPQLQMENASWAVEAYKMLLTVPARCILGIKLPPPGSLSRSGILPSDL